MKLLKVYALLITTLFFSLGVSAQSLEPFNSHISIDRDAEGKITKLRIKSNGLHGASGGTSLAVARRLILDQKNTEEQKQVEKSRWYGDDVVSVESSKLALDSTSLERMLSSTKAMSVMAQWDEEILRLLEMDVLAVPHVPGHFYNQTVRNAQIAQLKELKAKRDSEKVKAALSKLTEAANKWSNSKDSLLQGNYNLLSLAVNAARERATLGEISDALEAVFGRFKAQIKSFSGVYSKEIKDDESFKKAKELADQFAEQDGRRPRIMIAKMGQDGHDRGAKVVATGYADIGFDVDIGPLFQTPAEAARQAVENDVHVLGVSSLAAGHKTLVPQVIEELKNLGREDIMVIVGGVIPTQDYQFLFDAGVVAVFGPGTVISDAGISMLNLLIEARK